jgi:hypothetical protein
MKFLFGAKIISICTFKQQTFVWHVIALAGLIVIILFSLLFVPRTNEKISMNNFFLDHDSVGTLACQMCSARLNDFGISKEIIKSNPTCYGNGLCHIRATLNSSF